MGYDMEMEEYHDDKKATKKEQELMEKELKKLADDILDEAKKVKDDYIKNPSDISGSVVNIHENSPFLDSDEDGEPRFSGSRWKHVIKTK